MIATDDSEQFRREPRNQLIIPGAHDVLCLPVVRVNVGCWAGPSPPETKFISASFLINLYDIFKLIEDC